ncbi:phage tail tube protein [Leifsonia sp. P73]|uniref:phage tail tube protein n=1 Tax=Leifsonia sp. P73 TaxID=3423959 RepID=UPI003DA1F066
MSGTITLLARDWKLDVSTDGVNWVPLKGLVDFTPDVSPNLVDTSDYDTDGWDSNEPTMQSFKLGIKINRKKTAGVKDPGQEILRACQGQFEDAARAQVRYYKRADGSEAKQGTIIPKWTPSKTSNKDVEEIQIDGTGDGPLVDIANVSVTPPVPSITSVTTPGGGTPGTGAQITITGSGFTSTVATTGVKVGGTNAVPFTVVSDNVIVATVPTGAASTVPVVVTNATGASAAFNIARGA